MNIIKKKRKKYSKMAIVIFLFIYLLHNCIYFTGFLCFFGFYIYLPFRCLRKISGEKNSFYQCILSLFFKSKHFTISQKISLESSILFATLSLILAFLLLFFLPLFFYTVSFLYSHCPPFH